jgi:hypothetical protein
MFGRRMSEVSAYDQAFLGAFAATISFLSVLSVRVEQLRSWKTIFIKSDNWVFFENVDKIQVWLKSNKNNGYQKCRPMYIYDISMNSSQNEKCFRQKLYTKSKHTFCVQSLFPKTAPFMTMWKILYSRTSHRRQHGVCALGDGLHKATNTHSGYVTFIAFHGNNSYTNVPECYVIRRLPVYFFCDATAQIRPAAPHCWGF